MVKGWTGLAWVTHDELKAQAWLFKIRKLCDVASYADVVRLVTRSSPRDKRDKPKTVCKGGTHGKSKNFCVGG